MIPRTKQREKYHIKDLTCNSSLCHGKITKNIEVRNCDWMEEIKQKVPELHEMYYSSMHDGKNNNYLLNS